MGRLDDALAEVQRTIAIGGRRASEIAELGRIHALAGRTVEARAALQELDALAARGTRVSLGDLAALYLALGDRDRAYDRLAEAVRRRESSLLWLHVDPRFVALRGDARFRALLAGTPLAR